MAGLSESMMSSFSSATSSPDDMVNSPAPFTPSVSAANNHLPNDNITAQITTTIQNTLQFTPRAHQVKALRSLLVRKRDTILYAPTNAGKSLIAQVYPLLRIHSWVLCIIPLTRLGEEQVKNLQALPGVRGFQSPVWI